MHEFDDGNYKVILSYDHFSFKGRDVNNVEYEVEFDVPSPIKPETLDISNYKSDQTLYIYFEKVKKKDPEYPHAYHSDLFWNMPYHSKHYLDPGFRENISISE